MMKIERNNDWIYRNRVVFGEMIEVIGLVNTFDRYSSIKEEYKDFNRTLFIEMIKIKIGLFSNYELMTNKGKRSFLKDLESTINLIIKPLYPFLKRSDYYVIFDLLLNNSRSYHDIYKEVMKCLISNLLEKDEYYQFLDNPNYLNTLEKELAIDATEYIKNINIFVACFIKLMTDDILKNNFDLLIDYLYYSFYEFNQNIIEENESFRVVFAVINFYLFCIYDKVPKTSKLRCKIELFIDSDDLGGYSYTSSFEDLVKHFDFKLSLFWKYAKKHLIIVYHLLKKMLIQEIQY